MEEIPSIVATIVSSAALIGVAVGLIMQARQLKASQLQVAREMHLEIIKAGIERPDLVASIYDHEFSLEDAAKVSFLNLLVNYWRTSYELKTMSRKAVQVEVGYLFTSEFARSWWLHDRKFSGAEASTKAEKEYSAIVDNVFQNVLQSLQNPTSPNINHSDEGK